MAQFWMQRARWNAAIATLAVGATAAVAQPPMPVEIPTTQASPIPTVLPPETSPVIIPVLQPGISGLSRPDQVPAGQTAEPVRPAASSEPSRAPENTAAQGSSSSVSTATPQAQTSNATDTGDFLGKNAETTGVQIQKRNSIVADPRIRGFRSGQYYTVADGGLFFPSRPDLDTPISKYDTASVKDLIIIRGPYSALYGPTFAVVDLETYASPRAKENCGTEWHGRTSGGYQTNGKRWDGLQMFSVADKDWGLRLSYNLLQGNDYKSGDGTRIPNSYLSNNINAAFGFDLSPDVNFELKALKVSQSNLEFPGLYFDGGSTDTEAYSSRLTFKNNALFEKLTLDTWYNSSVGTGTTIQTAKQAFVNQLLFYSFNDFTQKQNVVGGFNNGLATFTDDSTSRFASRSIGYRLTGLWGEEDGANLRVGHNLNVLGQGLTETIRLNQLSGANVSTGQPILPGQSARFVQNTGVPDANMVTPGLFAQGTAPLNDRLSFTAGGRTDWAFASSNPRIITNNPIIPGAGNFDLIDYSTNPRNTALSRDYFLLSGFLSADYKVDEYITATASVGHSQRPPTLNELYAAGPFVGMLQQGTSRLIGDPNLSPEKLTQFDINTRADYGWLKMSATGFYAHINNYVTYDANRLGQGLTQVVFTNTNLATLAGAELFGQADLTKRVTFFGAVSYVQGIDRTHRDNRRQDFLQSSRRDNPATRDFASETEALPQIPPLEGRAGFRIHENADKPRWQIELSARMVAGQTNVARSLGESTTPGFTTFDVRGFWQVTERLLVTGGVENIGNRNYREHLDPISGNLIGQPFYRPGTNFFFGTQLTY